MLCLGHNVSSSDLVDLTAASDKLSEETMNIHHGDIPPVISCFANESEVHNTHTFGITGVNAADSKHGGNQITLAHSETASPSAFDGNTRCVVYCACPIGSVYKVQSDYKI